MLNWDPGNAAAIGSTPYPEWLSAAPQATASGTATAKTRCTSRTTPTTGLRLAEALWIGLGNSRLLSGMASTTG
jgi:hypothetical protein